MNTIMKFVGVMLVVAVVFGLTLSMGGCSTSTKVPRSPIRVNLGKVAVVPFENLSSEPNAGLIIQKNMDSSLRKFTGLELLDPYIMRQRLEAVEGEYLEPRKLGELLGVDSIVTGAVTEYRYVYGAGEQPVIGLNVQIIAVGSGAVLWSEQASSTGNFSWIREESLSEVAEQITGSLAKDLQRVYSPAIVE